MSGHEQDTDLRDSTPGSNGPEGAAGGMGVSSERVGPTGPGQVRTDGIRDDSEDDSEADVDLGADLGERSDELPELPEQHEQHED